MQTLNRLPTFVLGGLLLASAPTPSTEQPLMQASDPALRHFVRSTLDNHPRLRAAQATIETHDALQGAAMQPLYNPELSLTIENAEANTRALSISQTFDWFDKRTARTTIAKSNHEATTIAYRDIRQSIITELLSGLASYQSNVAQDNLARQRVQLMVDSVVLAKRRVNAGDLPQFELELAKLALIEAKMVQAGTAAELIESQQMVLSQVPESNISEWPKLPEKLPPLPEATDNTEKLLLNLPAVRAAYHQIDIAIATVQLRRREQHPDPTFGLEAGREGGESLIGLNVSIPLFVRNRFTHEVSAAVAEKNQAQQLADDVIRHARSELNSTMARYRYTRTAWLDWENNGRSSLKRQVEQLRQLWEAGELSTADYLVQIRQTLDVQSSALRLRQTLWLSWFSWLKASGQIENWVGLTDLEMVK